MGHPTMQENDTAKLTPTIIMLFIYQAAIWDTMRSIVVKLICLLK